MTATKVERNRCMRRLPAAKARASERVTRQLDVPQVGKIDRT